MKIIYVCGNCDKPYEIDSAARLCEESHKMTPSQKDLLKIINKRYMVEMYPGDLFIKDGAIHMFFRYKNETLGGVNLATGDAFSDDGESTYIVV